MSNEYLDWLHDLRNAPVGTKDHNHWLCLMFPWLIPHNRFTDEVPKDWNYEYTELDAMPDGWLKAFGEDMCFEIRDVLDETEDEDFEYRILQIKEKWGALRWYDSGAPKDIYDKLRAVLRKYEDISAHTCIHCGAPATRISAGWISPWCDECAKDFYYSTIPIEKWFEQDEI